jgi:hypothetical protein
MMFFAKPHRLEPPSTINTEGDATEDNEDDFEVVGPNRRRWRGWKEVGWLPGTPTLDLAGLFERQRLAAARYAGASRRERIIQPSELIKIRQSKPDLSAARACLETTATSATAEIAETQPEVLAQLEDHQGATFDNAESFTQKREFQYTPLKHDSGQIRLFVLSSETAKEELKCTLVVKDLDRMACTSADTTSANRRNEPQDSEPEFGGFVALSYV